VDIDFSPDDIEFCKISPEVTAKIQKGADKANLTLAIKRANELNQFGYERALQNCMKLLSKHFKGIR